MTDEPLVDIEIKILHETSPESEDEGAYLVDDGYRKKWLPKSKVENNGDGTLTMPEWLAIEKGLI